MEGGSLEDGGRGRASEETIGGGAVGHHPKRPHRPPQRAYLVPPTHPHRLHVDGMVLARVLATDAAQCDELEQLYAAEIEAVRSDACPCYDEERVLSRLAKRLPQRVRLWPSLREGINLSGR